MRVVRLQTDVEARQSPGNEHGRNDDVRSAGPERGSQSRDSRAAGGPAPATSAVCLCRSNLLVS